MFVLTPILDSSRFDSSGSASIRVAKFGCWIESEVSYCISCAISERWSWCRGEATHDTDTRQTSSFPIAVCRAKMFGFQLIAPCDVCSLVQRAQLGVKVDGKHHVRLRQLGVERNARSSHRSEQLRDQLGALCID